MTKITLMNIAEGTRILQDTSGRPHSFPCGTVAEIDLADAHIKMFTNTARSSLVQLPAGTELDDRFLRMLALVRDMHSQLTYNEALNRAREVFGLNAFRMRPQLSEIRNRVTRIAKQYAAAGFTGFDEIMKMEETRNDKPDAINPDKIEPTSQTDIIANQNRGVKMNIPRHVREAMAIQQDYQQVLEADDASGDPRVRERVILGRVPTATITVDTPRPVIAQQLPTASPGEFEEDNRDPDEIAAEIEEREANANSTTLRRAQIDTDADDNDLELDDEPQQRTPSRRSPTKRPVTKGKAGKGPAKKAVTKKAKKAGSRR